MSSEGEREGVREKGRRHTKNRRGKLPRSRESSKTLTIGKHSGNVPYRETCANLVVVYLVALKYYSHVFTV